MKRLFGLPTTTPNTTIIHSFGLLYITQAIDQKQFIYLHKILSREDGHWTKKMLLHLQIQAPVKLHTAVGMDTALGSGVLNAYGSGDTYGSGARVESWCQLSIEIIGTNAILE